MGLINATLTLVVLRESLEAFLIVSILAGLVAKLGRPEVRRHLLWGAAAALVLTVLAGVLVDEAISSSIEGSGAEPVFVGIASLVAVAILTYMVVWMYRNTMGLVHHMHQRAKTAIDAGKPLALSSLAFVAVIREGLETVILIPAAQQSTNALGLAVSALVGLAASAVLAFLVFSGMVRLNVSRFFQVSGLVLLVFAAGLLGTAAHELTADRLTQASPAWQAWDLSGVLDSEQGFGSVLEATFGYHAAPTWLDVLVYVGYLGGMAAWYLGGLRRKHPAAAASVPAAPGPVPRTTRVDPSTLRRHNPPGTPQRR